MTSFAGYDLSGQYKIDDNLIMKIDGSGRRRIRFEPVPASETEEAMQQMLQLLYRVPFRKFALYGVLQLKEYAGFE